MWGFASCPDSTFANCPAPSAPGPRIELPAGASLTVQLKNDLPVPVSLVVPGQAGGGLGSTMGAPAGQTLAPATAPSAVGTYTWPSLRAGSYLYQSGSYPSLEVPMGLYGALVVQSGPASGCGINQRRAYGW